LLVVISVLAGFTALTPAMPVPTVLYFPTTVGARWVYVDDGLTYRMVVTKVESKGEATLVSVGTVGLDGTTTHFQTVEVSPTGLREVANASRKCDPPLPLLRLPHTIGTTWTARVSLDGQDRGTQERTAGAVEQVKVPAGTFLALRVDTLSVGPAHRQQLTHWYAPGVGVVRVTYRSGSSRDLKDFDSGR
jgi:hypothetical protein